MKIAISGKGGVGKSTIAAALSLLLARRGERVLAVDADADANLADALGMPRTLQQTIVPISEQAALIEERTGAKVKQYGQMFKLNPEVSDIADQHATTFTGVSLLVLGAVPQGGSGCACPESVLLRALVTDLVLQKKEALILDMEAGVEHLGRATARGVDRMLVVVEPGGRSIECARRIVRMADEIGLSQIRFVANKVRGSQDEQFLRDALPDHDLFGAVPYCDGIARADRNGGSVLDEASEKTMTEFHRILERLDQETIR